MNGQAVLCSQGGKLALFLIKVEDVRPGQVPKENTMDSSWKIGHKKDWRQKVGAKEQRNTRKLIKTNDSKWAVTLFLKCVL